MNSLQRSRSGVGVGVGLDGGGGEVSRSSTADLSSPPSEPERPQSFPSPSPSHQLLNHEAPQSADSTIRVDHDGGEHNHNHNHNHNHHYSLTPPATAAVARHTAHPQPQPQHPSPLPLSKDDKPKIKRPRKKPVAAPDEVKEKGKPGRKPRASSGAAASARKKAKLEDPAPALALVPNGQSQNPDYAPPHPATSGTAPTGAVAANPTDYPIRTLDTADIDAHTNITTTSSPPPHQILQPPSPAPLSRLSYDPVRSMMVERATTPKVYSTAPPTTSTPSKPVPVGTSASPAAISHIIDLPTKPDFHAQFSQTQAPSNEPPSDSATRMVRGAATMEADPSSLKAANLTQKGSSGTPSNAPSPKPARAKEQPPPLPQGSGLLSSALFGNAPAEAPTSAEQAPSIVVHVKLENNDNNIINFAQLAEQKYGFAALHPRLAAQKERLARVAAAGAALEKSANGSRLGGTSAGESGDDDLSVDIDRDSDNEGDVAMTGVNGGGTGANSGTDATGPKKKPRKKKGEEYDQDDPFVDDSELVWEAQAAAVKDGFFVYCGPLVAEGEKPTLERTDGPVKRGRGRGRGGGPGSRGGRGGATASAGNGEGGGGGRGGGPGSRGGTTTRKPRVTKAGRAMMEREKQDREKMAPLAAKPTGYPAPG